MPGRGYQVIVIGGGHAGAEAAWAAANLLGAHGSVALVTLDPSKVGVMSCNPAIGGLAKGQLVREVDAMGGLMGLATDATGIQFRVLNRSKGEAVRGPRAQCDKHLYARAVQALIASRREIEVIAGAVERLIVEKGRCKGVVVAKGRIAKGPNGQRGNDITPGPDWTSLAIWPFDHLALSAPAVLLTTGTFMRGLMHTGETRTPGGRFGEEAATGISAALRQLGFELGRLKTGTPPRLSRASIRWNDLTPQFGDDPPTPFSDLTRAAPRPTACNRADPLQAWIDHGFVAPFFPLLPQVECRQTATNAASHELIRANLHRAPMFSGQIESIGPRYCPSIEDKVHRFAQRESHGVFLEPESLSDDWVYCNGISTSLPAEVQDELVRRMPGCESAVILRYGYAVEYDMVRPHQIHATGHTKLVDGLFLAGQINGTSGYEEAAAQGLVAGINAARHSRGQGEFLLGRDQGYIGVLMDDLVTKTPVEPYRMFTSRAEHRLLLRPDNSADRLTPLAADLGLLDSTALGKARRRAFERRRHHLGLISAAIASARAGGDRLSRAARRPEFDADALRAALPDLAGQAIETQVWETALADCRYEPFVQRQRVEIRRHAEIEHRRLPPDADYARLTALRAETRQALMRFRPATFGQAMRLEGVTPADITLLAVLLKRPPPLQGRAGEGLAASR